MICFGLVWHVASEYYPALIVRGNSVCFVNRKWNPTFKQPDFQVAWGRSQASHKVNWIEFRIESADGTLPTSDIYRKELNVADEGSRLAKS